MYVYTTIKEIILDLSFSDISNCCVYPPFQTVNSSKPSQPLHPPSCPHTVNRSKPSQQLHPPSCPHTFNPSKPSQQLHPPSCPRTVISSIPSKPLHPPLWPHTVISKVPSHPPSWPDIVNPSKLSQQLHSPLRSHTVNPSTPSQPLHPPSCPHRVNPSKPSKPLPCPHTSQQIQSFHQTTVTWLMLCPCQSPKCLFQKYSTFGTCKCNTTYKLISSVLFEPCSWLRKAAQKIANDCCRYTAGSNNCFNSINKRTLWFRWPT